MESSFLTFTDLSLEDIEELQAESRAGRKLSLRSKINADRGEGMQAEIIFDFHLQNLEWAIRKKMEADKISTFVSMMKYILEEAVSMRLSMADSFESFKQCLLRHSVQRPPFSVGIFSIDDVRDMKDYALNTFFRHFKLFQFVFVTRLELQVTPVRTTVMPAPCFVVEELTDETEVNPREQPELAGLFTPPVSARSEVEENELTLSFEAKVDERLRQMEDNLDLRLNEIKAN